MRHLLLLALLLAQAAPPTTAWRRHPGPVPDDLHHAAFRYGRDGIVLSHRTGLVLATTDGGESFAVRARLGEGFLESIRFVDRRRGWICGEGGRLYATTDGGRTWRDRSLGRPEIALYGIHFWDRRQGFLTGIDARTRASVLLVTRDGGATWKLREPALPGQGLADAVAAPGPSLAFVGGGGVILSTHDRGRTWQVSHRRDGMSVRDLTFVDRRTGWAVGHQGLVLRTTDGGSSWHEIPRFTSQRLRSVAFTDRRRGFLAGDGDKEGKAATLYETRDGGATWHPSETLYGDLHQLALTRDRIWAVGKGGAILSAAIR